MTGAPFPDDRQAVAWLHRRAGFGLVPAELRDAVDRGFVAELERLLAGAPTVDLWDDAQLPYDPKDRPSRMHAINGWLATMVASEQPLVDRVAWTWHGHFVSALDKVKVGRLMVTQARLFRSTGLGNFRALVRAVTIDPAMLIYLDLRESTGREPNENYARELLELFTTGEGNFSEEDVQSGALALSGWTVRSDGEVEFVPRRHGDITVSYLRVDGVHDLDTALDALMAYDALPLFIAATFANELLGTADDALVVRLAAGFVASNFEIRSLVRAALQAGLAGEYAPVVLAPVPWFVMACRITASSPKAKSVLQLLRAAGQLPMLPPNVAGWPGGSAWFAASSLVARANLAALIAASATEGEVLAAADGDDSALLASCLGLPIDDFSDESIVALSAAPPGPDRLAVALVTPEFLIA